MANSGCKGGISNQNKYTKKKRALFLIDCINEYNSLTRATKEARNYLRDSTVMWWRREDDDMEEWHEEKGDQIF